MPLATFADALEKVAPVEHHLNLKEVHLDGLCAFKKEDTFEVCK